MQWILEASENDLGIDGMISNTIITCVIFFFFWLYIFLRKNMSNQDFVWKKTS